MERKYFRNVEIKLADADEGIWECYGSTFAGEPDAYGDIVDRGAFKKTIKENVARIKNLWNHLVNEPIGRPIHMEEDSKGLYCKNKLSLGVQRAKEARELMYDGVVNETSIGYDTIVEKFEGSGIARIRHLKEVRLWDISPVTFAANPNAMILDVKAAEYAMRTNPESIMEALKTLQALLEQYKGLNNEPPIGTQTPEFDRQAADMESFLDSVRADINGFDAQASAARIEEMIEKIRR